MTNDRKAAADAGRWASEGGADPSGPATHTSSGHEAGHGGHATDVPAQPPTADESTEPPPGQEELPEEGRSVGPNETTPEEIGESG